ncbi:MAG: hypothetical protein K6B74_01610 [Ruminococcus sp.]|nr:hypothetical protein [Ruminococcus sp.]
MKDTKFDMKKMISNTAEAASTAMMFTSMIVIFISAIVCVFMFFRGKYLAALIFLLIAAASVFFLKQLINCDDRRIAREKREYRLRYITALKVFDLELGELYFEHDSKIGELALIRGIPALAGGGELKVTDDGSGLDTVPVRECVKRVLKDKDKIVEGMIGVVREVYEDEGITEEEAGGVPTDRDYILSRLSIDRVYLSADDNGWSACVYGYMDNSVVDHIGEHGLSADFTSDRPDYDFYSG